MRILLVMPSAKVGGGAEEALVRLLIERKAAGFTEVQVVFLERGELVPRIQSLDLESHIVESGRLRNPRATIRCIWRLSILARRMKPDWVFGWMTKAHIYSGSAAWLSGMKSLYFQHGLPDGGAVDRLSRRIPAAGALACSQWVADLQAKLVRHPVRNVGEPVDSAAFNAAMLPSQGECRRRLGLPQSGLIVGIVGRLQHWKGMHVYAKAMAEVVKTHVDCTGVIVGGTHDLEPEYPQELRALLLGLGLTETVRVVGRQSNVAEWMQAMDIVVHASLREPFGMVVAEAMAMGKAVIATKPGGPEEIIEDGIHGLLVEWADPAALAAGIRRFAGEPGLSNRCGAAAIVRAEDFTAGIYARKIRRSLEEFQALPWQC